MTWIFDPNCVPFQPQSPGVPSRYESPNRSVRVSTVPLIRSIDHELIAKASYRTLRIYSSSTSLTISLKELTTVPFPLIVYRFIIDHLTAVSLPLIDSPFFSTTVPFHYRSIIDWLQINTSMPPVPPPMDDVYADETLYFERSRIKQLQVCGRLGIKKWVYWGIR